MKLYIMYAVSWSEQTSAYARATDRLVMNFPPRKPSSDNYNSRGDRGDTLSPSDHISTSKNKLESITIHYRF